MTTQTLTEALAPYAAKTNATIAANRARRERIARTNARFRAAGDAALDRLAAQRAAR